MPELGLIHKGFSAHTLFHLKRVFLPFPWAGVRGRKSRGCVREGLKALLPFMPLSESLTKMPVNSEVRVAAGQPKAGAALVPQAWQRGTHVLPITHDTFLPLPAGLKRNKKQQLTMRSGPGVGYVHILIPEGT